MTVRFTRREFLTGTSAALVGAIALTGCARKSRILPPLQNDGKEIARLRINDPEHFKVLQFTDVHFFRADKPLESWRDPKTIELLKTVTDRARPDIIIVTGDLWHNNPHGKGNAYLEFAVAQLESLGRPWMFTWGNHDDVSDIAAAHQRLEGAKNSLYRGGLTNGNYAVEITDRDDKPVWRAIGLNTGEDGVDAQHQAWLKTLATRGACPPALAAFHIPLKQYNEAFNMPDGRGMRREKVGNEKEDGSSLAVLKEANARLTMCGHDHVSDYTGTVDGVMLSYGRSSGYGGYGGEVIRKGGKLYTINCATAAIDWASIPFEGEPYSPKAGERSEFILNK
jgi:3',5'-cyclic AMP phosphodiesterase CpdA